MEQIQSQFPDHLQSTLFRGPVLQRIGIVGITAQYDLAAFLCRDLPEAPVGVMPSGFETEEIDFQGDPAVPGFLTEGAHMT